MAIKAYKGMTPEWYTPSDQEGQDEPARFKIRGLTGPEFLDVQSHFDIANAQVKGSGLVLACRLGLLDWENIVDDEGKSTTFTKAGGIDRLPAEVIATTGSKIIALSVMDGDETKNS